MQRVVVIGAGAAGLAAASELARAGIEVTVLERAEAAGGRAVSSACHEARFDPMGPVLSTADRQLLGWIRSAGVGDRVRGLGPGGLAQLHGTRVTRVDASSRLGVARIPGVRPLDALRLVRLARLLRRYRAKLDADASEAGARWDDRSLTDFAKLYFGRSVAERWIGPFATSGTFQRPESASRLLFLLRAETHRAAPLASLAGGVGAFLTERAQELDVRLGSTVTQIVERDDHGFDVAFETAAGRGTAPADALVLATPAAIARRLAADVLVTAEHDFLAGVRYAPALALSVGFARRSWGVAQRVQIPTAERAPAEAISLATDEASSGLPEGGGIAHVLSTAGYANRQAGATDEVAAKELRAWLARVEPGTRRDATFEQVTRWPEAMPCFEPGYFRALAQFRRVHADRRAAGRRLYFAGDYLAGPWLEAAVGSGVRAARELRADG